MEAKQPSGKTRVLLEPYEVKSLITAAAEIEEAYAEQAQSRRAYYATHGRYPDDVRTISGDTLIVLTDLAKALKAS